MKAKKTLLLLCCFLFLPISMHLDKKRSLSSSEVKSTFYLANPYQNNYLSQKINFGGISGGIGIGALIGIVGESMNALTFYTPDINFWNENELLCNILNRVILTYAIDEDFDFILCTNPYYYLDEHLSEYIYWYKDNANLFDRDLMCDSCSFRTKISMVRNYGCNTFVNNPYTWSTLPNTHYLLQKQTIGYQND